MKTGRLSIAVFCALAACNSPSAPSGPSKGSAPTNGPINVSIDSKTKIVGGVCKVTDNGDGTSTTTCMDGTTFRTTNGTKTPEMPTGAP